MKLWHVLNVYHIRLFLMILCVLYADPLVVCVCITIGFSQNAACPRYCTMAICDAPWIGSQGREFTILTKSPSWSPLLPIVLRARRGTMRIGPASQRPLKMHGGGQINTANSMLSSRELTTTALYLITPFAVRDMTVFRPTYSGRCTVQINIGHFGSHGQPCDRPYYTITNAG